MLKKPLENATHVVKITDVLEGKSEIKGTKYFACKFENDFGVHTERFYITDTTMGTIMNLFYVCGLSIELNDVLDSEKLMNKELSIKIVDTTYLSYNSGELVKRKLIANFEKTIRENEI